MEDFAVESLKKLDAGGSINTGELDAIIGAGLIEIVKPPDAPPYHRVTAAGARALGLKPAKADEI